MSNSSWVVDSLNIDTPCIENITRAEAIEAFDDFTSLQAGRIYKCKFSSKDLQGHFNKYRSRYKSMSTKVV